MRNFVLLTLPLFVLFFLCTPSCARREIDESAVRERTDKVHAELQQFFNTMFKDMPKPRKEIPLAPSLLI